MRVGIISIQHESNTFVRNPTTIADFQHDIMASGEAVRQAFEGSKHEIGGFFSGLAASGLEAVPIFAARAVPGGLVTQNTLELLTNAMLRELETIENLDGLLVAPHGAAVCESEPDMDAYWLELVRQTLGDSLPIVCTIDPHANLSQRMIRTCDATIAYRTNPHIDQFERGLEAANLMARILDGTIRPTQAASFPPVVINIEQQHTEAEPCRSLYLAAEAILKHDNVLSNSIVLGFPYADVRDLGASFLVVTDNDPALAHRLATQLGDRLLADREKFVAQLLTIGQSLDQALRLPGPVCLLDMGDNIGGGSSGDGTLILHELQQRHATTCFACLFDPHAAQTAFAAGVGTRLPQFPMGGKLDNRLGPPLVAEAQVVSLHDGKFTENQVRHGGKTNYDMGPTAIVKIESGATIMLNSHRTPPFSLKQLTSCGINPFDYQLLIAKGVQAPLAAYQTVCKNAIRVNSAGPTCADLTQLAYEHRRKPLFPFEREATKNKT